MSTDDEVTAPQLPGAVEEWVYGGTRLDHKNVKASLWVDGTGQEHLFKHRTGRVVGCVYVVRVTRVDDEPRSMHGTPKFVRRCEDEALAEKLAAQHRAAEIEADRLARVRKAKADDPLELLIERLALQVKAAPAPQRAGLISYIVHKLSRSAW